MKKTLATLILLFAGGLLTFTIAQRRTVVSTQSPLKSTGRQLVELRKTPRPAANPVYNNIRVANASSDAVTNSPFSVPRFFAAGEIPPDMYPGVLLEGNQVDSQCDIRTRWPDGSVQYAVLSFRINVPPQGSTEVAFKPRDSTWSGEPLTAEAMLSSDYHLGAQIELTTAEGVRTVDVRDMLAKGYFRYWLKGPLVTQVIVEELTDSLDFDIEFNGAKSFHPIFQLTFYAGHPGVHVEFIGENAWIDRMQDLKYSLALRTGQPLNATPVYELPDFTQLARSRWRKAFWSSTPLPVLQIDYNLPYLIYSRAVPNYDLSLVPSAAAVNNDIGLFSKSDKGEPGGRCLFNNYMPTTGGRPELGPLHAYDVRYLFTMDPRLEPLINGCAQASGSFPIHYRESSRGRPFTSIADPETGETPDAFGQVVSIDARPYFCSREGGIQFSVGKDKATQVGPIAYTWYVADTAHQPLFTYLTYLLHGDWYSLEELYFWTNWNLANFSPGICAWCRGVSAQIPNSDFGLYNTKINQRAVGWVLRTHAFAATMAPDGTPEKTLLLDKLYNNIAGHEGRFGVTDGILASDPSRQEVWDYGRNVLEEGMTSPLGFWSRKDGDDVADNDTFFIRDKIFATDAPWQNYVILTSLGILRDFGYPVDGLHKRMGSWLLGMLGDPDYDPYLVSLYQMPGMPTPSRHYQTWAEVLDAFRPEVRHPGAFSNPGSVDFNYGFMALSATSFLASESYKEKSGAELYGWLRKNYPGQSRLSESPMWAIVPREVPTAGSVANAGSWASRFKRSTTARSKVKAASRN